MIANDSTAPFDRLKTMLQAGSFANSGASSSSSSRVGVVDGLRAIYREGGLRGFWRGNGANIVLC
jgi:hypothetical protein